MTIYTRIIIISLFLNANAWGFGDVNFDHSSGLDLMQQYSAKYAEPDSEKKLKQLRDNYERLKPSKTPSSTSPIIPKIIHQIWLGPKSIPQNYQYYLATWKMYHPDWQFKLWREEDLVKEKFASMDLFWSARSYQERSDLARYEILKRYGGLYIDTDIECFANFNELHHKYDFYTNFEPPAINKKRVSILNAMIASVPNHPIIENTLTQIRQDWDNIESMFEDVYGNSKSSFARSNHNLAVQRTMYPFADSVFAFLSKADLSKYKSMILPSGYNVPVYFVNNVPIVNFLSRMVRDKSKLSNQIKKQPETMSIHFHDKENSLMSEDYFANSLFNHSEIQGISYMLLNLRDKYYLVFRKLFQLKFPTLMSYNVEPVIPKVIYLENNNNYSAKSMLDLSNKWKNINPGFTVKILSDADLINFIPKTLKNLSPNLTKLIARFYLLQKNGGVYVESDFEPASLAEFNHKYGYYAKLHPLNKLSEKLNLDLSITASTKNHSIISNLLLHLEEKILSSKKINEDKIKAIYLEYVYRYYELDGASILFPDAYFNQKR